VSDKTGLVPFARSLAGRGWELVSTGGTARALSSAGLTVIGISEVTGFPEMMDGRVKTLHPNVHGGILARRHLAGDRAALDAYGIVPIDLVVVNLYPFARAAARADLPFDDLIEEIDIGGPSLVRAAAKNFRDVLVVVDPADYDAVLAALEAPDGPEPGFRFELARRAFAHTAAYDHMIAATLGDVRVDAARHTFLRETSRRGTTLPQTWQPSLTKLRDLRYGENPHQPGAWYAASDSAGPGHGGFGAATVHQGKELSFTNLLDLDAAARLALEFDEPAAVVIKHTNPCGVATGASAADAYVRAREADALSAFGGIVGLNRPLDVETARALTSTFIEAVIAPGLVAADGVLAVLGTKPNVRVVTASFDGLDDRDARSILGAWLVQTRDRVEEAARPWPGSGDSAVGAPRVVTRRAPTPEEWAALRFAWRVAAHVKSNTVVFTGRDVTLAVGAGQMSRVDAVNAAVMKGGDRVRGSVAASDAFFPFRDGLDAIAAAGATAVVQPGGSVRDAEVIAAADEHGLAMVFTGRRHFRH
jgi:phosphoribosylaminoimidazolecarboxamide formyltransferase/IMP cyclohydrolase